MERSGDQTEKLTSALSASIGTSQYLAHRLIGLERTFAMLHMANRHRDTTPLDYEATADGFAHAMEKALYYIDQANQIMGDRLNNVDACNPWDQDATGPGFGMAHEVLHPDDENTK